MAPPFLRPLCAWIVIGYKGREGHMSEFSIRTKTFRLGLADHLALYLAQVLGPATNLPLALPVLSLGLGFPVLETLHDLRAGRCQTYLLIQFIVLAVYALTAAAGALIVRRNYPRDVAMNGERIMVMDANAVRLIGPGFDVRQSWALFSRVRQDRHRIFLCLRSLRVHAIPKQAFASLEDAERLTTFARTAIRTARRAPASLPPLPEAPDNREIWRGRPFSMALDRPLGRQLQKLGATALGAVGFTLLVAAAQSWRRAIFDPAGLLLLFGVMMAIFLPALALLPVVWFIMSQQPDRRGPREVVFTRDYVRCTAAAVDTRADWSLVRDIERSSGTFVFRLAIGVFCIPASAFATRAQATAFFTQAVAFWRAAQARR